MRIPNKVSRIGIIGAGFIGAEIARRVLASNGSLDLAFVFNRSKKVIDSVDSSYFLDDLGEFSDTAPDMIVETAHPSITQKFGARFLAQCDYMPVSTTALIDDELRTDLVSIAKENKTKLYLAMGALIGGNELVRRRHVWKKTKITFKKNPANIDFSDVEIDPANITKPTTIFDGPVRTIAAQFPRNVNTMVTCALLSTGLDHCQGVLIADPTLDHAVAEVEAWGTDNSYIRTEKRQPVVGVSGTEMIDSIWSSIEKATRSNNDTMEFL